MKPVDRRREICRQKHLFGTRHDNKKPSEHQQKPAIYSGIQFVRAHGACRRSSEPPMSATSAIGTPAKKPAMTPKVTSIHGELP